MLTVEWRGKPVWIVRRTKDMAALRHSTNCSPIRSKVVDQPAYAANKTRSHKPGYWCWSAFAHLGCSPSQKFQVGPASGMGDDWTGGFFCPCHGSTFDRRSRFQGVPRTNLPVPPHVFLSDTHSHR